MNNSIILFSNVYKSYPLYHHITGGLKNFIFHLPKGIRQLKSKKYEALHDISFEIRKGETFGIIGRNGAGKSTVLGLIAGVLRPNQGTVKVMGRVSPLLELGAGFHPELSGRENIVLKGVLMGLSRAQVSEKLEEIIDFSELQDFIDQPIRVYSSGMLARLGFSVIVHLDPQILLIDEILAVGDSDFQRKCIARLDEFRNKGVTIVVVSHNMDHICRICDRVLWLENHATEMIGPGSEIVNSFQLRLE